jgi:CheY-like chemotaxis protein
MLLKGRRIFIVEDDIQNRAVMQILLERQGAYIYFERWGQDALNKLIRFSPVDVILLDLMLPNKISGYDIFTQIHAHPGFVSTPVIAVSATDSSEAIPKLREQGFSGFIPKPLQLDVFASQIKKVLDGSSTWARV